MTTKKLHGSKVYCFICIPKLNTTISPVSFPVVPKIHEKNRNKVTTNSWIEIFFSGALSSSLVKRPTLPTHPPTHPPRALTIIMTYKSNSH